MAFFLGKQNVNLVNVSLLYEIMDAVMNSYYLSYGGMQSKSFGKYDDEILLLN